jgi:Na+-transporting NADH:ubiquinone oxidoreductase subunit E
MDSLVSIFLNSVFVGNILFAYFLGMCSFLAVSKNLKTATGLGLAVVDLRFLKLILFIAVIAGIVQIVEMVIDRYSQALYNALGVFLPLITVNCAVLGASLFMVERRYTFGESIVYGLGSGVGWALAIISMATIQQKLRYADVPEGLQGFGISIITTGLMAMAFMLFSGITL